MSKVRFPLLVFFFGRFKWFRKLYGGEWVKSSGKHPQMPEGPWVPHQTVSRTALRLLVDEGSFLHEDYKNGK